MAKKMKSGGLLLLLLVLFIGMFAVFGAGVYNDSDQYIKMHIHREPLYPLFLALLRTIFGEMWLTAMGILQNILAAVSIWLLAEYITKKFSLRLWEELIVILLELMPYMITKYVSSLHLFIPNSVMSEAICLPLFTLFILVCFKLLTEKGRKSIRKNASLSLLLAFLLSLTRSQMMLTILMWGVVMIVKIFAAKIMAGSLCSMKKCSLLFLAVIGIVSATFFTRTLAVKSYNLVFNGYFINNTYGTVNTLTNILYAADREDGESIKDEEAKEFFYQMYDLTETQQANYKYAGNSWNEKVEHIEKWHDTVKFEMIEDVFYQTYDKTVTSNYIIQNLMADDVAAKMIAGLLPKCFARWFGNYLLIAIYGLIRSIAIVHPLINVIVLFLYLSAVAATVMIQRRWWNENRNISDEVWLMGLALLAIIGNSFAVAFTIMALSRYMIYGFATFYIAYFMVVIRWIRTYKNSSKK